jgi:hypothetical protein
MAAEFEDYALTEGMAVVCAESAFLWACAGDLDRARTLVHTFHRPTLDDLPRDVNWLLTVQCVLEAALAVADRDVAGDASRLLTPYEGRAVINAGAVMFHGVTDDTLARAADLLGDTETGARLRTQALATYERLGARWWHARLAAWRPPVTTADAPAPPRRIHFHPAPGGLWLAGPDGAAVPLSTLRGFGYLRELLRRPGQPVAALDLAGGGTGVVVQPGVGELLDKQALAAYRRRLAELDGELADAERWSAAGRVDQARAEREALIDELARATGLGGRSRTAGSSEERARVAVKKAISAAIDRLATVDEPLARHLRATVRTGLSCSYEPGSGEQADWVLD